MAGIQLPAGTFSWVDLTVPDTKAAAKFYSELLGWTADEPNAEYGGYAMVRTNGKAVAGLTPQMSPGAPAAWTTYVNVDDADATAEKAKQAGGQVIFGPMDVMSQGRMALVQDPTGAVIGLWQAGEHRGADVYNEPGALSWNELQTRDIEAAKRFYSQVFGWDPHTNGEGAQAYTEWHLNGKSIGGMMAMPEQVPAAVPPFWLPYFVVTDAEATTQKAKELGGQVMMPPMTIPQGTFAVLADPDGATFAVIKLPS